MADKGKNIGKVVLYHGSLKELNSRDKRKQYTFASDLSFISKGYKDPYKAEPNSEFDMINNFKDAKAIGNVLKEIQKKGYDGLVNVRSLLYNDHTNIIRMAIEGTPIILEE